MPNIQDGQMPEWYQKRRQNLLNTLMASTATGAVSVSCSPSGKYKCEQTTYVHEGTYEFNGEQRTSKTTLVEAKFFKGDELVSRVLKESGHTGFPLSWIENHCNGHDYAICNEDEHGGLTVIELDTGKQVTNVEDGAEHGVGFFAFAYYPSPDCKTLMIQGTYWGCAFDCLYFCDFTNPLQMPWTQVELDLAVQYPHVVGWKEDSSGVITEERDKVTEDGRTSDDVYLDKKKNRNTDWSKVLANWRVRRYFSPRDGRESVVEGIEMLPLDAFQQ